MFFHMGFDVSHIFKKKGMAQLVQLIRADGLKGHLVFDPLHILLTSGHDCQTGTGKRDL